MDDGREKPIADVLVGDAVMSLNTQTGKLVASRVNDLMVPRLCDIYEIHLSNGKVIETTSEHPFRTVSGHWAAVDPHAKYAARSGKIYNTQANTHLKEGLLLHGAENHARVTKIVETGRKQTVYHLAHVGMRNFFVEGVCVHNMVAEGDTFQQIK
jgi:intein/homing endonuclease